MPEAQRSAPFHVVGLGQCSWDLLGRVDHYPVVDSKAELDLLVEQGGGPAATALVTLARLGCQTSLLGTVGGDRYGDQIRRGLLDEGVDCELLRTDPAGSSQLAFIAVEQGTGKRTIFWHRGGKQSFRFDPPAQERIAGADLFLTDGLEVEAGVAGLECARENGVSTLLDGGSVRPGAERLLPLVDHLVVSEKFARQLSGCDTAESALGAFADLDAVAVVVTCGAEGCWFRGRGEEWLHVPAFSVDAVDTTGCGDVFHGGYGYGVLQGWPLKKTVRFASACAALKTRSMGGRTAIPSLAEVFDFLNRYS